jgi:hypothetical protein
VHGKPHRKQDNGCRHNCHDTCCQVREPFPLLAVDGEDQLLCELVRFLLQRGIEPRFCGIDLIFGDLLCFASDPLFEKLQVTRLNDDKLIDKALRIRL